MKIFNIATECGLGDALLITPALQAIKRQCPASETHVLCCNPLHEDILKHNPHIDRMRTLSLWRHPIRTYRYHLGDPARYLHTGYGWLTPSHVYDKKAAAIIADMVGVQLCDEKLQLFLTNKEKKRAAYRLAKYQNPIVIHTTAECSQNKNWSADRWEQLVRRNSMYDFVQIGLATEDLVPGATDYRGPSLRAQFSLIDRARAFIGVESVFAHAATALGTPAIVLFGPSNPTIWGHLRNANLYEKVRCSPCVDVLRNDHCPYSNACMTNISVDKVESALRQMCQLTSMTAS